MIGDLLKQKRMSKGVSLKDVAAETRVSVRMLQAIEKDDYTVLPGGIFNKSFVRQYARYLGMNRDDVEREILEMDPQSPEPNFKPREVSEWTPTTPVLEKRSSRLALMALMVIFTLSLSAYFGLPYSELIQSAMNGVSAPVISAPD